MSERKIKTVSPIMLAIILIAVVVGSNIIAGVITTIILTENMHKNDVTMLSGLVQGQNIRAAERTDEHQGQINNANANTEQIIDAINEQTGILIDNIHNNMENANGTR